MNVRLQNRSALCFWPLVHACLILYPLSQMLLISSASILHKRTKHPKNGWICYMKCYTHHQTLKIWFCSSPLLGALKTDLFFDVWATECLWRRPPRLHDTAGTGACTFQGTHQSLYLWGIRICSNYGNNAEFVDCFKQVKELYNLTTQNLYRMNTYKT